MTIWIAYGLGFITLPVGAALVFALGWAFGKSNQASDACSHCVAAGFRTAPWDFYERRRLAVWLSDVLHRVNAKRKPHRIAWQAKYDTYTPGGNLFVYKAAAQKKYGWPKRKARR